MPTCADCGKLFHYPAEVQRMDPRPPYTCPDCIKKSAAEPKQENQPVVGPSVSLRYIVAIRRRPPTDPLKYAVIDLMEQREVCLTWTEDLAHKVADALSGVPPLLYVGIDLAKE